jgi:hypothetical protein
MAKFICKNCNKEFKSKHSVAKFCSRLCSNNYNKCWENLVPNTQRYNDSELIESLQNLARELGKTPSRRDMDSNESYPCSETYQQRFGSWNNAVSIAGLEQNLKVPSLIKEKCKIIRNKLRFEILKRDNFTCQYCGGTPRMGYILQIDHIIPLSKGGLTEKENLITSCWVCNSGKSNIL